MSNIDEQLADPQAAIEQMKQAGRDSAARWTRPTDKYWPGGPCQFRWRPQDDRRDQPAANARWKRWCELTAELYDAYHIGFAEGLVKLHNETPPGADKDRLYHILTEKLRFACPDVVKEIISQQTIK